MNEKPKNKRYKPYTRSITVTELINEMPDNLGPQDIVIRHYPTSDTDTNRDPIITINRQEILTELIHIYGEWSYIYNSTTAPNTEIYNPQQPLQDFIRTWTGYVKYNQDNWDHIATAFAAKYNPIHNYDRTEMESEHRRNSTTTTDNGGNYSVTVTPDTETTTHQYGNGADDPAINSGAVTTTSNATTYDNSELVPKTQDVTTGSEKTVSTYNGSTTTYGGTMTTTVDGSTDLDYHHIHASGNIGITTSTRMINEINDTYRVNFLHKIVDEFSKRYLVLLPVDDDLDGIDDCGCFGWGWYYGY